MSYDANKIDVCVVWGPESGLNTGRRGVLQVTVFVPYKSTITEKVAFQAFLRAVKRIQDLRTQT